MCCDPTAEYQISLLPLLRTKTEPGGSDTTCCESRDEKTTTKIIANNENKDQTPKFSWKTLNGKNHGQRKQIHYRRRNYKSRLR